MKSYIELVEKVLATGNKRGDRTGVGTVSLFGEQMKFDLRNGFPAVTQKKLAFNQVKGELIAFIRGYRKLEDFHSLGVKIWDANFNSKTWAGQDNDLGRIYGVNWRSWQGLNNGAAVHIDQLKELVRGLKNNPYGRRHVVVNYNPAELNQVCLPACHVLFQCYVEDGLLDLRVDMRSLDLFLGAPFDIASYAILQTLIAKECKLHVRHLIFQVGDAHIYNNHIEQVKIMLGRHEFVLPQLVLNNSDLFNVQMDDIGLLNYQSHSAIAAEMAV